MRAYETGWLIVCGLLAMVGASMALSWSVVSTLVIFGIAATVGGAMTRTLPPVRGEAAVASRDIAPLVFRNALAGGIGAAAVVGLGVVAGTWALPVLALAAGTSPQAIRLCQRQLRRPPAEYVPPSQEEQADSESRSATGSVLTVERPAEPHLMTDTELCRAWRTSFTTLQRASSRSQRLQIVEDRGAYLDEIERRNPQGLKAWLASGARAAGNPTSYVVGRSAIGRPPIDWDGLIHGSDR